MKLRTRLIPVASLVVALGASAAGVAAAAAADGPKPAGATTPPAVSCGKPVTPEDKAKAAGKIEQRKEPDWAAIAARLGTTADRLQQDLMDTKIWIGQQTGPVQTPAAFLQHLADLLHQPVAKVKTVLYDADVFRDSTDKPAKPGKPGEPGKDQGGNQKADKKAEVEKKVLAAKNADPKTGKILGKKDAQNSAQCKA